MKPAADDLKAMMAKARSKLETARLDFANGRFEDAVSRAYYAAFHAMSAALLHKGLHFSSHGQVLGAFNREFVKPGHFPAEFTAAIQDLFDDRQTGDYDICAEIDGETARLRIESAEAILAAVARYLGT